MLRSATEAERLTYVGLKREQSRREEDDRRTPKLGNRDTPLESGLAERDKGRAGKGVGRTFRLRQRKVVDCVLVHGTRNLQVASSDSFSSRHSGHT